MIIGRRYTMKKKITYVIAVVLGLFIIGGITYALINRNDGNLNDKKDANETDKTSIVLKDTKKKGSNITQTFEIYMNNKKVLFDLTYTDTVTKLDEENGSKGMETLEGKFDGLTLINTWKSISNMDDYEKTLFDESVINREFTTDNFKIIKGEDGKEYLLVNSQIKDNYYTPESNYLYIFNDELKLINNTLDCVFGNKKGMIIHPGESAITSSSMKTYENSFGYDGLTSKNIFVKIDGNKIYYLYQNFKSSETDNYGTIEEREYTINDNKLKYNVVKSYVADKAVGQMP